jgi:CheY-like chemotaxis protein
LYRSARSTLDEAWNTANVAQKASPMKLLIVEDDPDTADTLATLLRLRGYEAAVAMDGKTALVELGGHFDAVLLDMRLPAWSGTTVLAAIRMDACYSDIPVVITTGLPLQEVEHLRDQNTKILLKPPTIAQVEECLAALVGRDKLPQRSGA